MKQQAGRAKGGKRGSPVERPRNAAEGGAGRPTGEAPRAFASPPGAGPAWPKRGSMLDMTPEPWGKGTERDSERVDEIVYGVPPRKSTARTNLASARTPPKRGSAKR